MIFGRKKKGGEDKLYQTLNNHMNQFQIKQFKEEFKDKLYTDYKETLQDLINELVSTDLKENTRK